RREAAHWRRSLLVNASGALVTATILGIMAFLKFREGGWVTIVATGLLVTLCAVIHGHYQRVRTQLGSLDETLMHLPMQAPNSTAELAEEGPTAIVLV